MATLRRPPFFQLPFPATPIAFDDQPQAVRDAWATWSLGNRVGYIDYQRIIRPARDSYDYVITMDMTLNGGVTTITYPPGYLSPVDKPLNLALAEATIGDIVSAAANREIPVDTNILVWATGPATIPADVDAYGNKFVGTYSLPAGTQLNQFLQDIGADYVAQFASLAGSLGDTIVFWFFQIRNGSLLYAGAVAVLVKTVAAFGCVAYWPLNEPFGTRRSIAQPLDLNPAGDVTAVAGPIDQATAFDDTSVQYLTSDAAPDLHLEPAGYTVALWLNRDPAATEATVITKGTAATAAATEFALTWAAATDQYSLITSDGIVLGGAATDLLTPPGSSTWFHLAITFDPLTGIQSVYLDGAANNTGTAPPPTNRNAAAITLAKASLGLNQWFGALADLAIWNRILTAAEITALYNAGAGLRYPFP